MRKNTSWCAIFVKGDNVWKVGEMHLFDKGEILPVTDEKLKEFFFYDKGDPKWKRVRSYS